MRTTVRTSVLSFSAKENQPADTVLVVCNFTPVPREKYMMGVPFDGYWRELLNSDANEYGGSDMGNGGGAQAQNIPAHGRPYSLQLDFASAIGIVFEALGLLLLFRMQGSLNCADCSMKFGGVCTARRFSSCP